MSDEGIERGAILLLSLGEEGATEVFKHLGPREVQKLGVAMRSSTSLRNRSVSALRISLA